MDMPALVLIFNGIERDRALLLAPLLLPVRIAPGVRPRRSVPALPRLFHPHRLPQLLLLFLQSTERFNTTENNSPYARPSAEFSCPGRDRRRLATKS